MEKNMQSLQPQSLTNDELERVAYITGPNKLPANWVAEILRRTQSDWAAQRTHNPDQLELDFS
jgi:hypothetical protein